MYFMLFLKKVFISPPSVSGEIVYKAAEVFLSCSGSPAQWTSYVTPMISNSTPIVESTRPSYEST